MGSGKGTRMMIERKVKTTNTLESELKRSLLCVSVFITRSLVPEDHEVESANIALAQTFEYITAFQSGRDDSSLSRQRRVSFNKTPLESVPFQDVCRRKFRNGVARKVTFPLLLRLRILAYLPSHRLQIVVATTPVDNF